MAIRRKGDPANDAPDGALEYLDALEREAAARLEREDPDDYGDRMRELLRRRQEISQQAQ